MLPGQIKITKVGAGETYIYVKAKNSSVQTEKLRVIVTTSETTAPPTTVPPTTVPPTTVPPTTAVPTTSAPVTTTEKQNNYGENNYYRNSYDDDNDGDYAGGGTVYVTPNGKKYHYSSACAGKNAMARDYNSVKDSYGPCKKCAQ